jgi:hypothetical protein
MPGKRTVLLMPNKPPGGGGIGENCAPVQYAITALAAGSQTDDGGGPELIACANLNDASRPTPIPIGPGRVSGRLPGISVGITSCAFR